MNLLVFQGSVVQILLPLLVVATQGAVDVLIFDNKYYMDNSFKLKELIPLEGNYEGVRGSAFVAVQANIIVNLNLVTVTWPNQQDNGSAPLATAPVPLAAASVPLAAASVPLAAASVPIATAPVPIATAPVRRSKPNLSVQTGDFRPDYEKSIYVLSTNPDIDGGRRFIQLPEGVNVKRGDSVEVSFTLDKLALLQQEIIKEITSIPPFKRTQSIQKRPLGDVIAKGLHGSIYSVSENILMKTCLANKPGTVVSFKKWAEIDYIENINRNDFRIGHLLAPHNAKIVGPEYFDDGIIDIPGNYTYYFTMEKIKGKPLTEEVEAARKALSTGDTSQLANIFSEMINALSGLHKVGVIHLDPHFGNFMRLEAGRLIIPIDFGLSRIAVEWEQHIINGKEISAKTACQTQPLRGDLDLGTDFSADMEFVTFMMLEDYILKNFFGPSGYKHVVMDNKIKVLTHDWTQLVGIKQELSKLNEKRDSVVTNLNDMLFLSPILKHCHQHPSLNVDQLTKSSREANGGVFPKNLSSTPLPASNTEVGDSGYLLKQKLPDVEGRYLWPQYQEYKNALTNIGNNSSGKLPPSGNASRANCGQQCP